MKFKPNIVCIHNSLVLVFRNGTNRQNNCTRHYIKKVYVQDKLL